jgi:hypothetical protein
LSTIQLILYMKKLKESFRLNGLQYILLDRNDSVALFGILGTNSDNICHYEVDIIYTRRDKYGEREAITDNDTFSRERSRCFKSKDEAFKYYNKLTSELMIEQNLSHRASKSIAGVQQNTEVVHDIVILPLLSIMGLYPEWNGGGKLGG